MPTTIKLKNSVTTTNAPSSLAQGEVAINITDKKVWVGNAATTPIQLLGDGGSASFTSIAFGAGTVSNPSITFTGDTNTGIYSPAADTIAFTEGGVESMRIDSSGNVGIGTSSPSYRLHTNGGDVYFQGANVFLQDDTKALVFGTGTTSYIIGSSTNNNQRFITNSAERMRIDSSGNLLFGVSSITGYSGRFIVGVADGNGWYSTIGSTSTGVLLGIRSSTASIGTVGATSLALNPDGGNVGIGTSSPSVPLAVYKASDSAINIQNSTSGVTNVDGLQLLLSGANGYMWNYENGANIFGTNNSERMRITSGGSLLIGSTSNNANLYVEKSDDGNTFGARNTFATYSATVGFFGANRNTTNNSFYYIDCYNYGSSTYRFRVADSGNATNTNGSYGTISDAKLKENIVDATPKLDKVNQLKVRNFNLIGDDLKQIGFIAQEFEQVFPSMVEESADKDADGNDLGTTTKTIKTTVLIPILVKAIQEQQAMIEELTNRIKKLEGV